MKLSATLSSAAAALCLLLSVWFFFQSASNQKLQGDLQRTQQELQTEQQGIQLQQQQVQAQQEQINAATQLAQQVGPAVLKDLGALAVQNKNEKIKNLLAKYGVQIQQSTPAPDGGAASATPKPAAAATPKANP